MRNRCHQPQRIVILINAEGIVQISFYFSLGRAGKFSFIVRQLAEDMDIEIDDSELTQAAERFALKRGGRSPRIARQFVDWLNARIELGLDY